LLVDPPLGRDRGRRQQPEHDTVRVGRVDARLELRRIPLPEPRDFLRLATLAYVRRAVDELLPRDLANDDAVVAHAVHAVVRHAPDDRRLQLPLLEDLADLVLVP